MTQEPHIRQINALHCIVSYSILQFFLVLVFCFPATLQCSKGSSWLCDQKYQWQYFWDQAQDSNMDCGRHSCMQGKWLPFCTFSLETSTVSFVNPCNRTLNGQAFYRNSTMLWKRNIFSAGHNVSTVCRLLGASETPSYKPTDLFTQWIRFFQPSFLPPPVLPWMTSSRI